MTVLALPPACDRCKSRDHVAEFSRTVKDEPMWACYHHPFPRPLWPAHTSAGKTPKTQPRRSTARISNPQPYARPSHG